MYFGTIALNLNSTADKYLMRILLMGGKKALTRKWLQPDAPTLEDRLKTVHEIYIMERLTFSIRLQSEKFKGFWSKWVRYISTQRPDLL